MPKTFPLALMWVRPTNQPISAADSGQGVRVTVSYTRVLAEDTAESGAKVGMVDQFEMDISFMGDLSEEQRNRLFEIANRCPIHRMLVSGVQIHATMLVPSSPQT